MRAVSIPFKRESVSEPEKHIHPYVLDTDSFNSLQTGKRIWTTPSSTSAVKAIEKNMFQFPSNGKAYLNTKEGQAWIAALEKVSIPFKRESVSELFIMQNITKKGHVSIPFKRESVSERILEVRVVTERL